MSQETNSFHLHEGMKHCWAGRLQKDCYSLQPTERKLLENGRQESQLRTHMPKRDKVVCVPVLVRIQVHQHTDCSFLLGVHNLRCRATLAAHVHSKQGEFRQVHQVTV